MFKRNAPTRIAHPVAPLTERLKTLNEAEIAAAFDTKLKGLKTLLAKLVPQEIELWQQLKGRAPESATEARIRARASELLDGEVALPGDEREPALERLERVRLDLEATRRAISRLEDARFKSNVILSAVVVKEAAPEWLVIMRRRAHALIELRRANREAENLRRQLEVASDCDLVRRGLLPLDAQRGRFRYAPGIGVDVDWLREAARQGIIPQHEVRDVE
jgi:hypothetical protein